MTPAESLVFPPESHYTVRTFTIADIGNKIFFMKTSV